MNALIYIGGADATDSCLLAETRIQYDVSRRLSTAAITVIGAGPERVARYDQARYDEDVYGVDIHELSSVTILDGRDGVTKLFEGTVHAIDMEHTGSAGLAVKYRCDLNDHAAWLDRSVAWGGAAIAMPTNDKLLIETLVARFCPQIHATDIVMLAPAILNFEWVGKTIRQCLDDICALTAGEWRVDYDAKLHYRLASTAPPAPFALSTSPNFASSFPVFVSTWRRDFSNPVNRCFVRGLDKLTGQPIDVQYTDPVSVGKYGEYQYSVVDDQLNTAYDAMLRAKTVVLKQANPIEQGTFTIWRDDLQCGQRVHIREEALGINGDYTIRALQMIWEDKTTVRYEGQFGAAQPDLETYLRLLEQRMRWAAMLPPVAVTPPNGSVGDQQIVNGGLSGAVINSVNAGVIQGVITSEHIGGVNAGLIVGPITATQIQTVNAGAILGEISSNHIGGVAAGVIEGAIHAGQIDSIHAGTIQGVIISDQLANGIIDDLAKYASALRPIPMLSNPAELAVPSDNLPPNSFFYWIPDGNFYQMTPDGMSWSVNNNPQNSRMNFYHIGAINAGSIIGLIIAAQIQSITAGQVTGQIQAGQIGAVNASAISGKIEAVQIHEVNSTSIVGVISGTKIDNITSGQVTGTFAHNQISSINAATITIGLVGDNQISGISGAKLTVGTVTTDKLFAGGISVGGGSLMPSTVSVYNATGIIGTVGVLGGGNYGGWFKQFGAGGTGYADAKVKTDLSGNATITDANLKVTNVDTASFVQIAPTTFDLTYGSISVNIERTSAIEKLQLISRGMVINGANRVLASFVRTPGTPNPKNTAELNIYNEAAQVAISLDGATGNVRCWHYYITQGGVTYAGAANGVEQTFISQDGKLIRVRGGLITAVG